MYPLPSPLQPLSQMQPTGGSGSRSTHPLYASPLSTHTLKHASSSNSSDLPLLPGGVRGLSTAGDTPETSFPSFSHLAQSQGSELCDCMVSVSSSLQLSYSLLYSLLYFPNLYPHMQKIYIFSQATPNFKGYKNLQK